MNTTEQFDPGLRETVEVRRHAGLAGLVGVVAAAVAIAWLSRATQSGAALDWVVVAVLALLAVGWLAAFVDARTPLLVADDHGVRIRLGRAWQGLPWSALQSVEHHPRPAWWRDGLLVLEPVDADHVLGEADAAVRRRAWLNRRLHGDSLVVPLGLATRTTGAGDDLSVTLRRLAQGATPVLEVTAQPVEEQADDVAEVEEAEAHNEAEVPTFGDVAARDDLEEPDAPEHVDDQEDGRADDDVAATPVDETEAPSPEEPVKAAREEVAPVSPVRALLRARRSEVRRQVRVSEPEVQGRELRRDGRISLVEETSGAERELPEPLADEIEEPAPRPDPVIGPMLTHARERIGLSVESLAERTRIRPHVIEAIEIDDFGPCGGDFYARGHLRTLGRVLGLEPGPLVKLYDERYADAPVNARKVFEAELAAGTGGIRAVRGGPNWSVVVAAVMAVVLAWSVAKLAIDDDPEPEGVLTLSQGSGGPNGSADDAERVTLKLVATTGTHVQVRNVNGKVVFEEDLESGDVHRIDVAAPVKVKAADGGAVEVEIDNEPQGTVGKPGRVGNKKFG